MKKLILWGSLLSVLAVIIGAFGAHALKEIIGDHSSTFETGSKYHFYHSLALIALGLTAYRLKHQFFKVAGICFLVGIILFSGSLYLLALKDGLNLSHWTWLGPITPIGGLFFITGWILMILGLIKAKENDK